MLTRSVWQNPGSSQSSFHWRPWLERVIPLTLGLGATTVICTTDLVFVQTVFNDNLIYPSANKIGFIMMQFVTPITAVMYPRIVRSVASAEKTDVMQITMILALAVGGLAAVFCTAFPKVPLQILFVSDPARWAAAPLVRWFVWALLPLTVSTVLVSNLLAKEQFQAVPWLVLVASTYVGTLGILAPKLVSLPPEQAFHWIVTTLGLFASLLAGVSAWFTWCKQATIRNTVG